MRDDVIQILASEPIILDLMEIIPSWRDVDLTKKGYNEQYTGTLIDVALYILEREKKLLGELHETTKA